MLKKLENFTSLNPLSHSLPEKTQRKDLIFSAFLDPSFSSHIITIGLITKSTEILELSLEILTIFFKITYDRHIPIEKLKSQLEFIILLNGLQHKKARELLDFLRKNINFVNSNLLLMDLFDKNERNRVFAYQILTDFRLKDMIFSRKLQGNDWVYSAIEGFQGKKPEKPQKFDFLSDFLNKGKYYQYIYIYK